LGGILILNFLSDFHRYSLLDRACLGVTLETKAMSKHRKHKKQNKLQQVEQNNGREDMVQCRFCGKKYSCLPAPLDTKPSLFIAIGDRSRRRWTLAACIEDFDLFEGEEGLGFVCADRQCIFRAFLEWREQDKIMAPTTDEVIRHFLSLSDEGKKKFARDVSAAHGYGHDDEDDSPSEQATTHENGGVQNPDQGNIFSNQTPE
jgi:hypothetical protein